MPRRRSLADGMDSMMNKINDLDFSAFSEEDRAMLIETMNAMKDNLEAAVTRAAGNKKPLA